MIPENNVLVTTGVVVVVVVVLTCVRVALLRRFFTGCKFFKSQTGFYGTVKRA